MAIGWTMLGIGMLTVFIVLLSVVLLGNLLIKITNQFSLTIANSDIDTATSIPTHVRDVLKIVVEKETGGQGRIHKIERLNPTNDE